MTTPKTDALLPGGNSLYASLCLLGAVFFILRPD